MLLTKFLNYCNKLGVTEKLYVISLVFLGVFYYIPNNKTLLLASGFLLVCLWKIFQNFTLAVLYEYIFLLPFQNGKGMDFLVVPPEFINGKIPFVMTPTISMSGVMTLLFIYIHIRRIIHRKKVYGRTSFDISDIGICIFFITTVISSITSDIPLLSFLLSMQIWGYIYVFYTIKFLGLQTWVRRFLFPIFASISLYEGSWSFLQFINKGTLGSWAENTIDPSIVHTLAHAASEDRSLFRMQGTFSHPNFLGFFMAITTPVLLYYSISRHATKFEKTVAALGFAVGSVGLALSSSRASWICYAIGIIFVFKPSIIRASIQILPMIQRFYTVCVVALIMIVPLLVVPRLTQLVVTFDPSGGAVFRWKLITSAILIVSHYPYGVGFGVFPKILLQEIGGFTSFPTQPHNLFAQILVACGYVGLFSFILFLGRILQRVFRYTFTSSKKSHQRYVYMISLISVITLSMFYPILTEQQIFAWFWILLSIVV